MKLLPKLINPPEILSGSLKLRRRDESFPNYHVIINVVRICSADVDVNLLYTYRIIENLCIKVI